MSNTIVQYIYIIMSNNTKALEKIFNRLVVSKINKLFSEFDIEDNMSLTVGDEISTDTNYIDIEDGDEAIEVDFSVYKVYVIFKDDSILSYNKALQQIAYMLLNVSSYVISEPYYTLYIYFDNETVDYAEDKRYYYIYTSTGDKKPFQESFSDFEGIVYDKF